MAAPLVSEETWPVMLEGWGTDIEPGQLVITARHQAADAFTHTAPLVLNWEDVTATGGLSACLDKGELILRHPKPCGQRIWSPCSPNQLPGLQPAS